ncbi:MAG: hypothetical protein R3A52_13360 [Polyangiales bacterium]
MKLGSQVAAVKGGTRTPRAASSMHGPIGGSAKSPRTRTEVTVPVVPSKRSERRTPCGSSRPSTQSATLGRSAVATRA